jgi:hypothetical protein
VAASLSIAQARAALLPLAQGLGKQNCPTSFNRSSATQAVVTPSQKIPVVFTDIFQSLKRENPSYNIGVALGMALKNHSFQSLKRVSIFCYAQGSS